MTDFIELDVRPILRSGGEPCGLIMSTLDRLASGQGLRLTAPFEPVPLIGIMSQRGFAHEARTFDDGSWEVSFTPDITTLPATVDQADPDAWPEPAVRLDNRDLDPPEPMVRILETIERLAPGQTVMALLRREPMFLFPELSRRGHQWKGAFTADRTTYELTVRVSA